MKHFEIEFLPEALEYLNNIPIKAKDKILFNMAVAKSKKDPKATSKNSFSGWNAKLYNFAA